MTLFNRTALQSNSEYLRYEERTDACAEDIANQAEAIQYASARKIKSAVDAKRAFDVCVAIIALALLSPIIVAVAAAIKLDTRGSIFFKQERVGINRRREDRRRKRLNVSEDVRTGIERRRSINTGRPFEIYKFRTMVKDAEKGVPTLACENDPRITGVGRLLRKTRIDEIPQFINVIKGEMSIIGPRPERSFFINQVKHEMPEFTMRLMVKPGITGLAQVEHGYTKTIGEMKGKLFYDLKYIADLSATQEIKILCKTFHVIVTGKGAC
jgi:lipopolysaccharide/colanic/teichoic acid biosynthesis glycosyltransferase